MEVILVMTGNIQAYILDNIDNLKKFNNTKISVITDYKFKEYFPNDINIIIAEELDPNYINYLAGCINNYRNGFWEFAKYRFKLLCLAILKYNLKNICHIENDVLIFYDLNKLVLHCNNKILLTIDSENRCIPGIMFIPNGDIIHKCIELFNWDLNDMDNFGNIYNTTDLCDTLPIFIMDTSDNIKYKITKNFAYYNHIFDAAAIGQYLGGIDPRNYKPDDLNWGRPYKFVNETCVFDYSKYDFIWKDSVPYIIINDIEIPIFNLHIHCKDLKQFIR
jgi:hypothetical protein